jgi:hypothetical protein
VPSVRKRLLVVANFIPEGFVSARPRGQRAIVCLLKIAKTKLRVTFLGWVWIRAIVWLIDIHSRPVLRKRNGHLLAIFLSGDPATSIDWLRME